MRRLFDLRTAFRRTLAGLALLVLAALPAAAQTLIRDAETEAMVAGIADPIFTAAGLDPASVRVFLIQDDALNAFVAGGQNLFIHTGLIGAAPSPEALAGVIAHETGHIAGGHLSRTAQAGDNAARQAMMGALLGAAAALAGAPQVGTALIAGGATVAERGFLSYTRGQEQAADQAAITFLDRVGLPPEGLLAMFEVLERDGLRLEGPGTEFLRTHPLTRTRILFVQEQAKASRHKGQTYPEAMHATFGRVQAKLAGFLDDPDRVLRERVTESFDDRYARSVARFRRGETDAALKLLDGLIAEHPDDPWLLELKGQVLFESGRVALAVAPYRAALAAAPPDAALLKLGLARALMEGGGDADLREAANLLQQATAVEPKNPGYWRFLGIALGRLGEEGKASLALAETAVIAGRRDDAFLYLARAERLIPPADPSWLRLQDLRRSAEDLERQRNG